MIKVFDTTNEFETYSTGGLKSGELCYVAEDKTAHFRTNNIDGEDKVYDMSEGSGSSEPELTWVQATPNANYYNIKMVDGLEIGKTYRIHITYTLQENMYDKPYFFFMYLNDNSWNNYSNIINTNDGKYYQIQIEADSEDFYYDITLPKFMYTDGADNYGIGIEQGMQLPVASMEIALLHD